ncbi:O-acetylserine/cysteine exporter, partial [Salmonella enterica subsp. enterica serovar Chester]|nr:O-acetylserine/cysteine exporter [Salmonella enterica subsp. enterica serovar Chester]
LVAWSALVPIIPFILMSLWMEGADAIVSSISHISLLTVGAIMYLAYLSTFVGYTLWSRLLGRYETWRVTPFALLVPFAGIASSALLLGETITMMQFAGLGFIMAGLILTVFGKRLVTLLTRRKAV